MKKFAIILFILSLTLSVHSAFAVEETAAAKAEPNPVAVLETKPSAALAVEAATPAAPTATDTVTATTPTVPAADQTTETAANENLEFVSGEITAVDETTKAITVKLYGENEDEAGEKTLAINTDDSTDITDGEKDRDLKSLTAGTEVDVEYDPASKKATYIFVY